MADYGEITLHLIESTGDFWALWDEMVDDNSGFLNNRDTLLEAYKEERLWGLTVSETDSMFYRGADQDPIFCKREKCERSLYLLPCLCITNNDGEKITIIWTHSRARKRGFARKMVKSLVDISPTGHIIPDKPLKEAIPFWNKVLKQ